MQFEQLFYYSLQEMYAYTTHMYADGFECFVYSFLCVSDVYITGIVQEVVSKEDYTNDFLLCTFVKPFVCPI